MASRMRAVQAEAKEIKKKNPKMTQKEAIGKASKKLKEEGWQNSADKTYKFKNHRGKESILDKIERDIATANEED